MVYLVRALNIHFLSECVTHIKILLFYFHHHAIIEFVKLQWFWQFSDFIVCKASKNYILDLSHLPVRLSDIRPGDFFS